MTKNQSPRRKRSVGDVRWKPWTDDAGRDRFFAAVIVGLIVIICYVVNYFFDPGMVATPMGE